MTEIDRGGVERLARSLWATHQESAALMSHERVYRMAFRHAIEALRTPDKGDDGWVMVHLDRGPNIASAKYGPEAGLRELLRHYYLRPGIVTPEQSKEWRANYIEALSAANPTPDMRDAYDCAFRALIAQQEAEGGE